MLADDTVCTYDPPRRTLMTMLKLIKNSTLVAIAALSFQLLALTPPTYQQKVEQIRSKISLNMNTFSSEFDRVAAVNQIHDLIFNSDKSSYFSKESGLVQEISIVSYNFDFSEEDLAGITALKGHELTWPTGLDLRDRIAASLDDEHTTLFALREIRHMLQSSYENLKFLEERDYEVASNNSNLENLANLRSNLDANAQLRSAFNRFPNTRISSAGGSMDQSGVEFYHGFDWEGNAYDTATVHLGHKDIFNNSPFMNEATLGLALEIAYLDGFGVLSGYWMKNDVFEASLREFNTLLEDAEIKRLLKDNKVHNVVFDEEFRRKNNLFENNKLVLGTTIDDMKLVINLLFR